MFNSTMYDPLFVNVTATQTKVNINVNRGTVNTTIPAFNYNDNNYRPISRSVDNSHRIKEIQKILLKHPNRTDLKIELRELQKSHKPKIGRKKK